MARAWAIKLGSGGRCVRFCEDRGIVGVGWRSVEPAGFREATREQLRAHVTASCTWYSTPKQRGNAVGQLWRFGRECAIGDLVLYYDPPRKHVRVCQVTSDALFRDFDLGDAADIWHYRRVEYPVAAIPILDFDGVLKGRVLGPRSSFWEVRPHARVDQIAQGIDPDLAGATDPEVAEAFRRLRDLVLARSQKLDATDWEWVVVDFLKAQGAHVDERRVGGSRAIIDAEARFPRGELGDDIWRVQVKRYQDRKVVWAEIEADLANVGDDVTFCYVSVFGFTDEARTEAADRGVRLLEAEDFARFLLSGRLRARLRRKLALPNLGLTTA